jgi:hypothetical protein
VNVRMVQQVLTPGMQHAHNLLDGARLKGHARWQPFNGYATGTV